eukprot:gene11936-5476_t
MDRGMDKLEVFLSLAANIHWTGVQAAPQHHRTPGLNPRRFQASWSLKMIETRMDDDLCIIFGSIPKAGSSTIRIWLKSLGGTHNADAAQRLGRGKIVQKQLGYSGVLPDSLRKECFTFTFLRDPVDRYVSGLYESHRKSDGPSAVNVPELTYAFVADGNTAGKWLDPKQNSIFNVGQLDYLRTRQSNSSTSTWDFVGRLDHFKEDWMQVHSLVHAKFGRNPWDPSLNPTPDHHGASSASATARDSLPSNLIKIICTLYADDYCCLNLPIPSQCDIACHHTTT